MRLTKSELLLAVVAAAIVALLIVLAITNPPHANAQAKANPPHANAQAKADAPESAFRYYRDGVQAVAQQEPARFMNALDAVLGTFQKAQADAFAKALVVELGLLNAQGTVTTAPTVPPEAVREIKSLLERYTGNPDALFDLIKANAVAKE